MTDDPLFGSIHSVASRLPFALQDLARVNAAYEAWIVRGDVEQRRIVELWTYCFVRRYVLLKFATEEHVTSADVELLVDRIYRKIDTKRSTISDVRRYAGWVAVLCRNTYLNFRRGAGRTVRLDPSSASLTVAEPGQVPYDTAVVLDELHAAISRLPPYLREIAVLRLVQDASYEEIARQTGFDIPIVRSYVSKIVRRLRREPELARLLRSSTESSVR